MGGWWSKIKDIQLNEELDIPLYIFQYTPFCIKVKFADDVPISPEAEMIYSAGLLQSKYRNDRTITFPFKYLSINSRRF